jgi:hypothetical protein
VLFELGSDESNVGGGSKNKSTRWRHELLSRRDKNPCGIIIIYKLYILFIDNSTDRIYQGITESQRGRARKRERERRERENSGCVEFEMSVKILTWK